MPEELWVRRWIALPISAVTPDVVSELCTSPRSFAALQYLMGSFHQSRALLETQGDYGPLLKVFDGDGESFCT